MNLDTMLDAIERAVNAGEWREGEESSEEYMLAAFPPDGEHSDTREQRERYVALHKRLDSMGPRRVTCTFDIVTPESAEHGDTAERGWRDFIGEPMEGADSRDEDASAVDNAVDFLRDAGATEPSSSAFHAGIWWSTVDGDVDYSTGEEERRSYHFRGPWTVDEQRAIFDRLTRRAR